VHGWELDPAVLAVARDFFGLAELKKDHAARLSVHIGELEKDHVAPELKGKGTREAEGLTTNSFWGLIWAEEDRRSRST